MFSHFLHIFSSVSPKRIKRVFYKIKYSELMFFIYVCVKKLRKECNLLEMSVG